MEQENREIKENYSILELKLANTNPCRICSKRKIIPENGRQTDLEKLWQKSKSNAGIPTFTPHIPPIAGAQGPMSLPTELVNDAQREVRRLQELRRYIQEECDQLLLKKDRLKEEVGENPWHVEQSSTSLDAYFLLGEGDRTDFPVTRSVLDMNSSVNSLPHYSSDHAFKVVDIYSDILDSY